ncbi:phage baseplate assembly protein V [Planctomycetota bacterium]
MSLHTWLPGEADLSLDQLLRDGRETHDASWRIYGVVPAIVTAVADKKNKRHMQDYVQVRFPWLQDKDDKKLFKPWARCTSPDAGNKEPQKDSTGFKMTPQVDDEVLVAFEHGDPHVPYVLGSLWNKNHKIPTPTTPGDGSDCTCQNGGPSLTTPDLKPKSLSGDGGDNKVMYMKSRTGNLLVLDDDKGTIRIADKTGQSAIQLEQDQILILQRKSDIRVFAKKGISFTCETYQIHASSKIKYHADKGISVSAKGNVSNAVGSTTKVKASKDFSISSKKTTAIRASMNISFNAMSKTTISSAEEDLKVESAGMLMMSGLQGINMKTDAKGNMEGKAMITITSPMKAWFIAKTDFEAKGAVILLN